MSPTPKTTTARRITRATLLLAVGGALFFLALPVSAAADTAVCHATGSESNPYVLIMTSAAGAFNGHLGDDHQNGEDIIPPFEFAGETHSQNWDEAGQAIFEDCGEGGTTTETDTETSGSESDTETDTGEIPVFGSGTTLALGIGGALGGTLLMLRRKL